MKYLCLVYGDEADMHEMDDQECADVADALVRDGSLVAAEALQPISTATTVRIRSSGLSITDGPFAETKEQLAGFYLVEARDLNDAIRIASKIPPVRIGSIEVRPIRQLNAVRATTEATVAEDDPHAGRH